VIEDVWLSASPDEDRYVWEGPGSPRVRDLHGWTLEINEFLEIKNTPTRLNTSESMIFMLSLKSVVLTNGSEQPHHRYSRANRFYTVTAALSLSQFISAIIR